MDLPALLDRALPPGSLVDRAARKVQGLLMRQVRGEPAASVVALLRGNEWLGHPLHPVVVAVPIGAWTVTGWYDLRAARGGDPRHETVADAALRVGVLGAGVSAATGLAQFLDTRGAARREAAVHAGLNNAALGLYVASMLARSTGRRPLGVALAAVGLGAVSVSGYLGGDLSYRRGVGVQPQPLVASL